MKKIFLFLAIIVGLVGCSSEDDTPKLPTVTTGEVSSITSKSVVCGGNVSAVGGVKITARGVCWSTTPMPTILNDKTSESGSTGEYTSALTGLIPVTQYYVRAYVTSNEKTIYGNQISFTTSAINMPTITTNLVASAATTSAVGGGNVSSAGDVVITSRGVCWSMAPMPTISDSKTSEAGSTGEFTSALTGLIPATGYYARAYVTSAEGTIYGNQINFATPFDIVAIGNQQWSKQNLNVDHYRNGDVIPQAQTADEWTSLNNSHTGAWCYYANDSANGTVYGKLYNWYAVMDSRGLAPEGFHVSTNAEWNDLTSYLGGTNNAGGAMKDLAKWNSPNSGATNASGFSALPGGELMSNGFGSMGIYGRWWTSTEDPNQNALAWYRILYSNSTKSEFYHNYKESGLSVRCVKD